MADKKKQGGPAYAPLPPPEDSVPAVDDPTRWFTVVYRDISPGDEARLLAEHPKAAAVSWSHALHDRVAALAALRLTAKITPATADGESK